MILVVACAAICPNELEAALLALLTRVLATVGPPKRKIPPTMIRAKVMGIAKAGLDSQSKISSNATMRNKIHPHFGIAPM